MESWFWTLFEDGERLVLDVICQIGPSMTSRAFVLDGRERARYDAEGRAFLDARAAELAEIRKDFPPGYVPRFSNDARVIAASRAWAAAQELDAGRGD